MKCRRCKEPAQLALPSHHTGFCPECFKIFYARQVERAVKDHQMFTPSERVLVAVSGGKDSLALMLQLQELGYAIDGLHIDLGIPESSPKVRAIVEEFCAKHSLRLHVAEMESVGLAIPMVKRCINRPICSMCGKIKRYYFNKYAVDHGYRVLATGHNLDDETARLFANTLRWDHDYLSSQGPVMEAGDGFVRKVKPLYRLGEFENAAFAFFNDIPYGVEPCPYSGGASFTNHKELIAGLEENSPGAKLQFYENFLKRGRSAFSHALALKSECLEPCDTCGHPTPQGTCGVCRMKQSVAEKVAELAESSET